MGRCAQTLTRAATAGPQGRARREMSEVGSETNVPTQHAAPQEDARVSNPHAHPRRQGSDRPATSEGSGSALGVGATSSRRRVSPDRLTTPQEFTRVLRGGRSRSSGGLVVHVISAPLPSPAPRPRLGLVLRRDLGTAVARNRIRRQLREAWRGLGSDLAPVDCVIVVRSPAVGRRFADLAASLRACLEGLGVVGSLLVRAVAL